MLNTSEWGKDDCTFTAENIEWLDEKLSENEDGRPIFVMIHQPLSRIHTKSDARLTFEEVIAKHPSAIVSHGHTHYGFGNNPIVQEGKGTYINIPSLTWNSDGTCPTSEYYFVEVYEGGVVYRAREYSTDSWYVDSDAAVKALSYADNPLFDAKGFEASSIEGENVTAASSSEKLSLTSGAADGFAVIAAPAAGEQTRYAGYALLMKTDRAVKVAFNGAAMKNDGVYYTVAEGRLVTHTAVNGALPSADGWVLIPAESFSGEAFPGKDGSFRLTFTAAGQTAAIYKASYYFDAEDFCWAVSNLTYVFYADGVVYASGTALYGEKTHIPAVPRKNEDAQYRYTFAGWDVDGDGEADDLPQTLLADLSATAVFEKEIKEYTYTFIDPRAEAEGKNPVVKTETAVYGTEIAAPELADILGWDLDEDGAAETLPAFLTCDFTASAIYKNTVSNEYENAVKVFEAGSSAISISHSGASAESLTSHTNTAVVNEKSPTGYAARFQYNAVASDGRTHAQVNASTFLWMDVSTELEGAYTYEEFGGWAIWIDVPYTEETYYGGLRVNNNRVGSACADGFTTVDNTAQVKTYASKWVSESMLPDFGNAFTGWLIVKKEALYESTALPKATTPIGIQIKPTGRVTPFTMDIGQIMVWTDYDALVEELVSKTQQTLASKKSYLFKDADGYVYKAGEAAANERIIVPADPVGNNGYIFTGWDLDNDGYPDELPENGLIEKPLVAVAVFKNSDQCETLFKPGTGGWTKNSQKDGTTTNGLDYMTAAIEENEGSPTDSALHITIDPTGGVEGNRFNAALWLYAQIPAQSDDFDGLAVWINIPDANGYCFSVALTGSKEVVLQMKDVTWVGSDGMISTTKSWQKVYRNAPFEGWLIFPRECFPGHVLNKDSNLRFWWEAGDSKNITENWNMYLGPVLGYRGSVSELTDSFKNVLYSFRDYDGALLSCGIVKAGSSFAPPAAPTRASDGYYSYEFAGWDVDKDGVADLLPESLVLPLNATAVYTRKGVSFTYAFKDKNGETIFEKTLPYGSLILPPFRYDSSYADETHDYIFDGWEGYEEGMLLTENCSFGVRYTILNAVTQISGVVAENKVYDGTADVRLNLEELVLTGVAENDEVCISFESAVFESADAGKGIAVIVSGIKLTGKDAYKYSLRTGSVLSLSAEITPKTITEVKGITADDKIYDGSASATLDLSGAVLEGITDGDEVTVEAVGEFSDKNAGSDLTVTVTEIKLTGAKAGNYVLAQGLTVNGVTASILKKQIVVTADAKTVEKGSSEELTYRTEGLVGEDTLGGSLEREPGEEVGAYEIKIGTLANDNYEILFTGAVYTITEGSGSSASGEESTGGSSVKVGCGSVFGGSVQALSLALSAAVGFAIFKKKRGDR